MPINYQNSKIYTIRSHQTDKIYIGSTVNELKKRLHQHKSNYKKKKYCSSCEIVKYDDCYIELFEKYPCNDKDELRKREGEIIRSLDCVNKTIPARTKKQYRKDNEKNIKKYNKEYNKNNKEKIIQYATEYRNNNKKKISKQQKEWYQKNKNKVLKDSKNDYDIKYSKKIVCVCGSEITIKSKIRHEKTKKHINFINKENVLKQQKEINYQIHNKYICVCGSEIQEREKNRHEKTKKHINFINN